jgi:hypothetical protein
MTDFYELHFEDKLAQLSMKKRELASILGKHENAIQLWRQKGDAPAYVHAFLDLEYENRALRAALDYERSRQSQG